VFINDRANLPCPGIRRVAAALPADFVREADAEGQCPGGTRTRGRMWLPTNHQLHETIEITHGFTDWFETGFYILLREERQGGITSGATIRPRVRVPPRWHWPSASASRTKSAGRAAATRDTWTWEIRPIVDNSSAGGYLSFNPTFDRSFHGPGVNQGVVFSPNFKFSYDFTKKIAGESSITVRWVRSRASTRSANSNSKSSPPST